jgi:hypothetical protein
MKYFTTLSAIISVRLTEIIMHTICSAFELQTSSKIASHYEDHFSDHYENKYAGYYTNLYLSH